MSEPIQSIAQNNYILATQQEVSHDSSLSGNGTVDSPLGVVPGYNETVLWEANTATPATLRETCMKQGSSAVNLSESKNNFEKLEVWAIWNPNAGQGQTVITTYPASNYAGGWVIQAGSNSGYMAKGAWSATDTTFKVWYAAQSDTWPNFWEDDSYGGIIKVIGINRISGYAP